MMGHPDELDKKIVAALERIAEAFRVLLWNEGKTAGLSPLQVQVLLFVSSYAPAQCRVTYLAREFNITKATLSDAVKVLETKGLVGRLPDPADSRSHVLRPTGTGSDMAAKFAGFADAVRSPVSGLPEGRKLELWQSLLAVIGSLQQAGVVTLQRMCFTCRHFGSEEGVPYCTLIGKVLEAADLRMDCPEHEAVG